MLLSELLKTVPELDVDASEIKDHEGGSVDTSLPLSDVPLTLFVYPKEREPCTH